MQRPGEHHYSPGRCIFIDIYGHRGIGKDLVSFATDVENDYTFF
jgi:hypothetical protein